MNYMIYYSLVTGLRIKYGLFITSAGKFLENYTFSKYLKQFNMCFTVKLYVIYKPHCAL